MVTILIWNNEDDTNIITKIMDLIVIIYNIIFEVLIRAKDNVDKK